MKKIIENIINSKNKIYILSPHLDDAIFSMGGLINEIKNKRRMLIVNVFTKSSKPYTVSAKKFLKQCGYKDAKKLYIKRNIEDKLTLNKLKINNIDLKIEDAIFRKIKKPNILQKLLGNIISEFLHIYPTYKFNISKGIISKSDKPNIEKVLSKIKSLRLSKDDYLFAPMGIGNHVDHKIANEIARNLESETNVIYYADYPYVVRETFDKNNLTSFRPNWIVKENLLKLYSTQFKAVFGTKVIRSDEYFLLKENNYFYHSKFLNDDPQTPYSFTIYKDSNNRKIFAKSYKKSSFIDISFKWIRNEIEMYKALKPSWKNVKIPKYIDSKMIGNKIDLYIEYINGKKIGLSSNKEKIKAFENVLNYLNFNFDRLNKNQIKKFINRGNIYWVLIGIISFLRLIFFKLNISDKINACRVFAELLQYSKYIVLRKNKTIVHRDFSDNNIIRIGKNFYLIDFQLMCIADPLLEMAIIYVKYFKDKVFINLFLKSKFYLNNIKNDNDKKAFAGYIISIALYDQTLLNGDHETTSEIIKIKNLYKKL